MFTTSQNYFEVSGATRWRLSDESFVRRAGMSRRLLKFSGGSVDDYAICRSS
jgi:hypothetical protein